MTVRDDVVIADAGHALHLAQILRRMAIETHRAGLADQDHAGKTARLFEYLRSEEFREHLGAVVETGGKLDEMLQKERRAHERTWSQGHEIYTELSRQSVAIDETISGIIESDAPSPKPSKGRSRKPGSRRRNAAHTVRA